MWASLNGHDKVAQLLIESGAQVDAVDLDKFTPLMRAARHGHLQVAQVLIPCGATLMFRTKVSGVH